METHEHTDRLGRKWVFALSDVLDERGRVAAV